MLKTAEILNAGSAESTGGRKSKKYRLNENYMHIGVIQLTVIHQSYIIIGRIINLNGKQVLQMPDIQSSDRLEDIDEMIKRMKSNDSLVRMIAVSVPGVCRNGTVGICDYDCLPNVNLPRRIQKKFRMNALIENDVNLAVIGLKQNHPSVNDLAVIYQSDTKDSGSGIMINSALYTGFTNFAGEVSFLPGRTSKQQKELLKKSSTATRLLEEQILAITAVINPELVGWHSDVPGVEELKLHDDRIKEHLPQLEHIEDFRAMIYSGLFGIVKDKLIAGVNTQMGDSK